MRFCFWTFPAQPRPDWSRQRKRAKYENCLVWRTMNGHIVDMFVCVVCTAQPDGDINLARIHIWSHAAAAAKPNTQSNGDTEKQSNKSDRAFSLFFFFIFLPVANENVKWERERGAEVTPSVKLKARTWFWPPLFNTPVIYSRTRLSVFVRKSAQSQCIFNNIATNDEWPQGIL